MSIAKKAKIQYTTKTQSISIDTCTNTYAVSRMKPKAYTRHMVLCMIRNLAPCVEIRGNTHV